MMHTDYMHILPEVLLNLYYFCSDIRASFYRVWGKSVEARYHTGLLFIDRKASHEHFSITKVLHAPDKHRPYGVILPDPSSICGCDANKTKWVYKTDMVHGAEVFFAYSSSCRHTDLHVAVYPGNRRLIQKWGTQFIEESWDQTTHSFTFRESSMVRMITLVRS
jgi:hypothetical protein